MIQFIQLEKTSPDRNVEKKTILQELYDICLTSHMCGPNISRSVQPIILSVLWWFEINQPFKEKICFPVT